MPEDRRFCAPCAYNCRQTAGSAVPMLSSHYSNAVPIPFQCGEGAITAPVATVTLCATWEGIAQERRCHHDREWCLNLGEEIRGRDRSLLVGLHQDTCTYGSDLPWLRTRSSHLTERPAGWPHGLGTGPQTGQPSSTVWSADRHGGREREREAKENRLHQWLPFFL